MWFWISRIEPLTDSGQPRPPLNGSNVIQNTFWISNVQLPRPQILNEIYCTIWQFVCAALFCCCSTGRTGSSICFCITVSIEFEILEILKRASNAGGRQEGPWKFKQILKQYQVSIEYAAQFFNRSSQRATVWFLNGPSLMKRHLLSGLFFGTHFVNQLALCKQT